jgi:hypothetical protein
MVAGFPNVEVQGPEKDAFGAARIAETACEATAFRQRSQASFVSKNRIE